MIVVTVLVASAAVAVLSYWLAFQNWQAKRNRQRWREQGLCVRCGYDIRGSPDASPELWNASTARARLTCPP